MLLGLAGDQKEGDPGGGGVLTSQGQMLILEVLLQRSHGQVGPCERLA